MNFLDAFSKNTQISKFTKIRQVGAESFHADTDGRTDGQIGRQAGTTKVIAAFHNFAKTPKNLNNRRNTYTASSERMRMYINTKRKKLIHTLHLSLQVQTLTSTTSQRLGSYRAVNTLRLRYENQLVSAVQGNIRSLFRDPYKTHKSSVYEQNTKYMSSKPGGT